MNRPPPMIPAACLRPATALLACLVLAACGSSQVELPDDALVRPPEEQEPAYIPTYSKTVVAGWPKGRGLSPYDASRVRLNEQVHAYHLGRLPSHDRQEMHEAHTVYRLEQEARWDTRLPATPMDSRGVVLGVIDPARKDVPDDTFIAQERQALVKKSAEMRVKMAELDMLGKQLQDKKHEFEKTKEDMTSLTEQLQKVLQERAGFEAQLKDAEARIKKMKEDENFRILSSKQNFVPKK